MTEIEWKNAKKVIKEAKKLGVKSMRLGTLEFEFSENESPRLRPTFKVSKKKIEAQTKTATEQLKFDEAMSELSAMHVEDPVGYERALIENDLLDGEEGGEIEGAEA